MPERKETKRPKIASENVYRKPITQKTSENKTSKSKSPGRSIAE